MNNTIAVYNSTFAVRVRTALATLIRAVKIALHPERYYMIEPIPIGAAKAANLTPRETQSLLAWADTPAVQSVLVQVPVPKDRDMQCLLDIFHATQLAGFDLARWFARRPDQAGKAVWEADRRQRRRSL